MSDCLGVACRRQHLRSNFILPLSLPHPHPPQPCNATSSLHVKVLLVCHLLLLPSRCKAQGGSLIAFPSPHNLSVPAECPPSCSHPLPTPSAELCGSRVSATLHQCCLQAPGCSCTYPDTLCPCSVVVESGSPWYWSVILVSCLWLYYPNNIL